MKQARRPEGEVLYGIHAVSAALEARRRPVRRLWLLTGGGKGRDRREPIATAARASRVPVAYASRDVLDRRALHRRQNRVGKVGDANFIGTIDHHPTSTPRPADSGISIAPQRSDLVPQPG